MKSPTIFRRYWISIAWGGFIFLLTGLPGQFIPQVPGFLNMFSPDKLVHVFIFGVFVVTLMYGFVQEPGLTLGLSGFYALLIALILGGVTELLQGSVFINRQESFWDFIANVVGSILGYGIFRKWKGFL